MMIMDGLRLFITFVRQSKISNLLNLTLGNSCHIVAVIWVSTRRNIRLGR